MTDRVIDIAEEGARISVKYEQLVFERGEEKPITAPLEEVAVLVLANRAVTLTQPALAGIAKSNGMLIVCDERSMPIGMMLPLAGHHLQCERFAMQANAAAPIKKRAWQQLIQAKVRAQGRLLKQLRDDDFGFPAMAERVASGDPDNVEGQAARRYWPLVFSDDKFKRNRDLPDGNTHLNYGYAVLRAIVARGICAAGLHPSLGVHHHNRYDAFPLADDLMEPFRPVVDRAVIAWCSDHDPFEDLNKDSKAFLITALMGRFTVKGEERTLFDIAARTASSLVDQFAGSKAKLHLPEI